MPSIDPAHFLLLFVAGCMFGVISVVSGSAGLLITPLLMFIGLSPVQAIATQNLYAVPLHVSATWRFWKRGLLPLKRVARFLPILVTFSVLGALSISHLPVRALKLIVPVLLIGLTAWVATNPSLESRKAVQRLSFKQYGLFVLPFLAFYDGFFGTCSTTFYTVSCIALLNLSALEATAISKPITAATSFAVLFVFAANGNVEWMHGLALALGGVLGAQVGVAMVIKHGARLIRIMIIIMSGAASLKLLADQAVAYNLF
jgi:hypothetical protein